MQLMPHFSARLEFNRPFVFLFVSMVKACLFTLVADMHSVDTHTRP